MSKKAQGGHSLAAWDTVCRQVKLGELGTPNLRILCWALRAASAMALGKVGCICSLVNVFNGSAMHRYLNGKSDKSTG